MSSASSSSSSAYPTTTTSSHDPSFFPSPRSPSANLDRSSPLFHGRRFSTGSQDSDLAYRIQPASAPLNSDLELDSFNAASSFSGSQPTFHASLGSNPPFSFTSSMSSSSSFSTSQPPTRTSRPPTIPSYSTSSSQVSSSGSIAPFSSSFSTSSPLNSISQPSSTTTTTIPTTLPVSTQSTQQPLRARGLAPAELEIEFQQLQGNGLYAIQVAHTGEITVRINNVLYNVKVTTAKGDITKVIGSDTQKHAKLYAMVGKACAYLASTTILATSNSATVTLTTPTSNQSQMTIRTPTTHPVPDLSKQEYIDLIGQYTADKWLIPITAPCYESIPNLPVDGIAQDSNSGPLAIVRQLKSAYGLDSYATLKQMLLNRYNSLHHEDLSATIDAIQDPTADIQEQKRCQKLLRYFVAKELHDVHEEYATNTRIPDPRDINFQVRSVIATVRKENPQNLRTILARSDAQLTNQDIRNILLWRANYWKQEGSPIGDDFLTMCSTIRFFNNLPAANIEIVKKIDQNNYYLSNIYSIGHSDQNTPVLHILSGGTGYDSFTMGDPHTRELTTLMKYNYLFETFSEVLRKAGNSDFTVIAELEKLHNSTPGFITAIEGSLRRTYKTAPRNNFAFNQGSFVKNKENNDWLALLRQAALDGFTPNVILGNPPTRPISSGPVGPSGSRTPITSTTGTVSSASTPSTSPTVGTAAGSSSVATSTIHTTSHRSGRRLRRPGLPSTTSSSVTTTSPLSQPHSSTTDKASNSQGVNRQTALLDLLDDESGGNHTSSAPVITTASLADEINPLTGLPYC